MTTDAPIAPILRPATEADTGAIQRLIAAILAEYGCSLDLENVDAPLVSPCAYFRKDGGEVWVVDIGGAVLATVAAKFHGNTGELKSLYVAPHLRRQGWGRSLTQLVIDYCRSHGCERVFLWSDTRFHAAHRLYERMNFVRGGVRDLHDINHTREYRYDLCSLRDTRGSA